MGKQTSIPCVMMRGGTSKGAYFLARDLPRDPGLRDRVLLAAMGSPDKRQIDGIGGADSLTSKVAIVSRSTRRDSDVDYLFAQVLVDAARVDTTPTCGNILAGVGAFAIEQGLIEPRSDETTVRIYMVNTESRCDARILTPKGMVEYDGDARISGVPGSAAPVMLAFADTAGSSCGALLPTGSARDLIDGVPVTCIDNGMPVVILDARSVGATGRERPDELDANAAVKARVEAIRLQAGPLMNLGDVTSKVVPKMSLVSAPSAGGAIGTRTFIPHKCHDAIGVLGAVSVATACMIDGSVAATVANLPEGPKKLLRIEHPSGEFAVELETRLDNGVVVIERSSLLRTARRLFEGRVLVPGSIWDGTSGRAPVDT
jgi:4-oxalomesaconate tautomerase